MNPHEPTAPASAADATAAHNCGCESTGLKRAPQWEGLTLAQPLPVADSAEAAPEPEAPQGEWLAAASATAPAPAPLSIPLAQGQSAQHPVELLAPAGGLDAAYAAFHYGADAVYLGLKKFSARAEAENFTLDDVDAITAFAHSARAPSGQPRRVFVTLNTLILQHELKDLTEALGALNDIGVDALIIQDWGTYRVVRRHFPGLELHASTQLAVHNRAGAEALRDMGFTRVVLARELTLEEVRDITTHAGVETEVFIHGALCYSYSGLCLFSSQTLGRSGNRGKCAYTCRDSFEVQGAPETLRDGTPTKRDPHRGFAFSMKDLALPDALPALRAAGVSCLKIEGRKKSPLYVATTTDYYRRLLDGSLPESERAAHEADMKSVFSRPWTRLFSLSHRDKEVADRDTVGHRGQPIGRVEAVQFPGTDRARLRFRTERPIERHDGLQIDLPTLGKPFGCAVETLELLDANGAPSEVYEAPAGALVQVALPEEHPALPDGAPIYCSSSQAVKRRYRFSRPKKGQFRARRGMDAALELSATQLRVELSVPARRSGEAPVRIVHTVAGSFSPAKDPAKTLDAARGAFTKLGETPFEPGAFTLTNPDARFAPVSLLNEARREACEQLAEALDREYRTRLDAIRRDVLPAAAKATPAQPVDPLRAFHWSLKVDRIGALDDFEDADFEQLDELVVDIARDHPVTLQQRLDELAARVGRDRLRLALPAVTRKWEEKGLRQKLDRFRAAGWTQWEAANPSAWNDLGIGVRGVLQGAKPQLPPGLDLATDWTVYAINRQAVQQLLDLGASRVCLSPEDGLDNMRSLLREFRERAVVIVHQDTPLFMAESCGYANLIGGCPGKANCKFVSMEMVSSYGEKVTAYDYHCRTLVLNRTAFCLSPWLNELHAAGARHVRADFIYRPYEPAETRSAWRLLRAGQNIPGGHCANFERGLL